MASARELLEQADALMRRNRTSVVDTEIPELTDMVAMVALAPAGTGVPVATGAPAATAAPIALDDVPELTEAVEEIEIESIAELPEDSDESSGWLHNHGELSVVGRGPDSTATSIATRTRNGAATVERAPSALSVVAKSDAVAMPAPTVASIAEPLPGNVPPVAEPPPKVGPVAEASSPKTVLAAPAGVSPSPGTDSSTTMTDDWARWEALADEIRMQVLQRVDIFTDTGLRDQLSAQLQPIVDRASAEMISTINAHVGGLLRAYIAEAIEREIEKWREAPR